MIRNKTVTILFVALFALNVCELMLSLFTTNADGALWWLRLYYVSAIFVVSALLFLGAEMAGKKLHVLIKLLLTAVTFSLVLLALTSWTISGAQSIGYSVRAVYGDYYHLLTPFFVFGLVTSLAFLTFGTQQSDRLEAKRCVAMLIAVIPLALVAVAAIFMMYMGYEVNATCALSLAVTTMIAVLVYTDAKHNLFFIYSYLPWTKEYRHKRELKRITRIAPSFYNSGVDARELQKKFEEILINMAIEFTDGNQKQAAELLNLPPTTVWRKLKEYQKEDLKKYQKEDKASTLA